MIAYRIYQKIAEGLLDDNESIVTLLRLCKQLCEELHAQPASWMDLELNGYDGCTLIPEYRQIVASELKVESAFESYPDGVNVLRQTRQVVIDQKAKSRILSLMPNLLLLGSDKVACREPFAFYEDQRSHNAVFVVSSAQRLVAGVGLQKTRAAYIDVSASCGNNVLIRMRAALRKRIEKEVENMVSAYNLKDKVEMSQMNFTITGNNNQVAAACGNLTQSMTILVAKSDWSALSKVLSQYGITADDQKSLKEALEAEPVLPSDYTIGKPRFGAKVSAWMADVMQKVLLGVYNVEIGVMANMLSTVLLKYYGIG